MKLRLNDINILIHENKHMIPGVMYTHTQLNANEEDDVYIKDCFKNIHLENILFQIFVLNIRSKCTMF